MSTRSTRPIIQAYEARRDGLIAAVLAALRKVAGHPFADCPSRALRPLVLGTSRESVNDIFAFATSLAESTESSSGKEWPLLLSPG